MLEWWNSHGQLITVISITLSLCGTALGICVLVNLPPDFFLKKQAMEVKVERRNVLVRLFLGIAKNALGAVMLVLGLLLSIPLVPGPGVVMLLIGMSLMAFPGKKYLELRLLKLPGVLVAVNSMRRRFNRAPFELPQK